MFKSGIIFTILLLLMAFSVSVDGGEMVVSWQPNSEPDMAGYKIYWGLASRKYTSMLDVGLVTERVINEYEFVDSTTYYFAITAYDTAYNESGYSNESSVFVVKQSPDVQPPEPPGGCSAIWR